MFVGTLRDRHICVFANTQLRLLEQVLSSGTQRG